MIMKTVVSYAYYETTRSMYNLNFFAQVGIIDNKDILFIIVINGYECSIELPDYENCIIIKKENSGFDFGAHKASIDYLLKLHNCDIDDIPYDNFIFMNSGVIGPFLPTYYPSNLPWTTVFTAKLNEKVKFVGTSLGCFDYNYTPSKGPHIEGFCFCLDKIGLITAFNKNTIFINHLDKGSAIVNGEFGLSKAILEAGFSLDCLLYKYQNVDWLNIHNWLNRCNSVFPSRTGTYDNISIHPFEVVFHKWFWEGRSLVNFEYVETYVKWKLDEIVKNKKIYVTYGCNNFMINITKKFTELFIKDNKIIIPTKYNLSQHFKYISNTDINPICHLYIYGALYIIPNIIINKIDLFIDNPFDISAHYGRSDFKIDVSNKFINTFVTNNKIIIPKEYPFNECFNDVCPGSIKTIYLKINEVEHIIEEHNSTNLEFSI